MFGRITKASDPDNRIKNKPDEFIACSLGPELKQIVQHSAGSFEIVVCVAEYKPEILRDDVRINTGYWFKQPKV